MNKKVTGIMVLEREVIVEGTGYHVVISDEQETLLAAKAAGRVFVGLLQGDGGQALPGVEYAAESPDAIDEVYLEHVVRRRLGLPWIIGESERLLVREFTMKDISEVPMEPGETEADELFHSPEKLEAYIHCQYRFFEYGIWAVVRKSDGVIVGKAGVTDALWPLDEFSQQEETEQPDMRLELGYHIFRPYRGLGYAQEASRIVLHYAGQELTDQIYAAASAENAASNHILQKLGFRKLESYHGRSQHGTQVQAMVQKCTESMHPLCRYVWN